MVGGGLGRVYQCHALPHKFADHSLEQRVVGAAQDQGVHPGVPHLGEVLGNDQPGHLLLFFLAVVHISGLYQGHEQGAGLGKDLHARHQLPQQRLIAAGADGGRSADDTDAAVAGGKGRFPGSSVYHAQIRHRQLCCLRSRIGAGHRAAGCHDAFYIFRKQECDILTGVLQDRLRAAAPVRHTAGIAEIDDILMGQTLAQLPHAGQPAKAAVKYADGAVIHAAFPSFPAQVRSGDRSGRARGCPRAP